jgi:hypothetical protein
MNLLTRYITEERAFIIGVFLAAELSNPFDFSYNDFDDNFKKNISYLI